MLSFATPSGHMQVREARPEEYEDVGALTASVYVQDGHLSPGDAYVQELRAAADRARDAQIIVAVTDGRIVGSVTFALAGSPWANLARPGEAEFRMLVVAPEARRAGVGRALVEDCVQRARAVGSSGIVISTQPSMEDAHRLYARTGFVRVPERDWSPGPGIDLMTLVLALPAAPPEPCPELTRPNPSAPAIRVR